MDIKVTIKEEIAQAIATASEEDLATVLPLLESPKNREHGDLAFPCFQLAKKARLAPPQVAQQLAAKLKLPESVTELKIIGPFLNFRFARDRYCSAVVNTTTSKPELNLELEKLGPSPQTIVIDYSSPNIAKPFHVGHLRATLIGNSLYKTYTRLGYNVVGINHLGDWGTQFGFVWAGCKLWGKPAEESVKELVQLYRRATTLKDNQEKNTVPAEDQTLPNVNEMAREFFIELEGGKQYAVDFWKWNLEISIAYLQQTYKRLGVTFDHYTGESFYSDKLDAVKADLAAAGLLVESQGAYGVDLGEALGFARILAPDGRSLYLTRDLATAKYRAETFNFSKALYVVGTPQSLHFQQLCSILEKLDRPYAKSLEHVAFGHVMGMKTRGASEVIELNDFLDEAYERALSAYREQVTKRPEGLDEMEVADAVGLAALVFSTLSRTRLKDVHFSWEHALAFQGDSGPYLLYAYARINGVKERAREAGLEPSQTIAANQLTEESAFQLCAIIDELPAVLRRTVEDNDPAHLAAYGLEVAKEFSRAYNDLKVVGEESRERSIARLTLFEATRKVLGVVIDLLGMKRIERM